MPDETQAPQRTVIDRTLSLGINVADAKELPQVGRYLARFLKTVDHEHGPFDVNLAISVNPTEAGAIGPVEYPVMSEGTTVEVVMVQSQDDGEPNEEDE